MVLPAPQDAILIDVTGDTTGFVTGNPPNDATGDLDATIDLPNPGWTYAGETWEISDAPDIGTATINFATGEWTYTIDPDEFADLDDGEIAVDTFEVEITAYAFNPGGQLRFETTTETITITVEGVCFAAGTRIGAEHGPVAVEHLAVGDRVATRDNGLQPIRWIEGAQHDLAELRQKPDLWPVVISRGALGPESPSRDLVVSQQHRILMLGPRVELMFGTNEVLVAAKSLTWLPGIAVQEPCDDVAYFHILLDRHEILDAEGAPAESLFLGEEALHAMTSEGLQELSRIFEDRTQTANALFGDAARMILTNRDAMALA